MLKKRSLALLACTAFAALSVRGWAQTTIQPAHGYDMRKNFAIMAVDDGPPDNGPDGSNMVNKLIVALDGNGWPVEMMFVTCHFITDQPSITDVNSPCRISQKTVPLSMLQFMLDRGYVPRNHSDRHVPINYEADNGVTEFTLAQNVLDPFQPDGLALMRCPGLSCHPSDVVAYHQDPYLKKLLVLDQDVGGGFVLPNGVTVVADAGCPVSAGLTVAQCGQLFIDAARKATHGIVFLMHIRTDWLSGADGNEYHLQTILDVMNGLPEFTWVTGDALSGFYGNIHSATPIQVSSEFGTNDGQGPVTAADTEGRGATDLCKARGVAVWCKTPVRENVRPETVRPHAGERFQASTPWLYISDPDWTNKFGSRFWLVDINQDGMADLVYPISDPDDPSKIRLMVAYSTGFVFAAPVKLLDAPLDPRGIRFGDVNGDGTPDLVAWTPQSGVLVYLNHRDNFSATPVVASMNFPASDGWGTDDILSTMSVRDVNGDGRADLIFDGSASVQVALSGAPAKNNWSGFATAQTWTYRMSDQQSGWVPPAQRNFQVVKIAGKMGIAQGMPIGIVFHEADPVLGRFTLYRYLDNSNYTNILDDWHPERYASGLVFADFDGSGNESPLLVRSDGLYIGSIEIAR